jgi:acyl-CoA thioester hydrolase
MLQAYEYLHTVGNDEIDEQGHANNVVYVAWMQAAAIAHSATLGWTAERYQQMGAGWVARSHTIEYLRPAYVGEEIIVQTHVADMKKVTSTRQYRILRRADRELLARAETNWAFIDYTTGKPTRIPAEMIHSFTAAAARRREDKGQQIED